MPTDAQLEQFHGACLQNMSDELTAYRLQARGVYHRMVAPEHQEQEWRFATVPPSLWHELSLHDAHIETVECGNGIFVCDIRTFAEDYPELARKHIFERNGAVWKNHKMFSLLEGYWNRGAVVFVPRNTQHKELIDIPALLGSYVGDVLLEKVVVIVESGAQVTIKDGVDSLVVASSMIVRSIEYSIDDYAQVTVLHEQHCARQAHEFLRQTFLCGAHTNLVYHVITTGSQYMHVLLDFHLVGRGAHAVIRGAYALGNNDTLQLLTTQRHHARDTHSDLLIKGGVGGTARAVYQGTISIAKEASGVTAKQNNKNMLTTDGASATSVPNLEVCNSNVSCSHGSAVGQLDAQQLFYAQSRGLPLKTARRMLLRGFFADVFGKSELSKKSEILFDTEAVNDRLIRQVCGDYDEC
jgi:Fe-S cluster assembly protein SufD